MKNLSLACLLVGSLTLVACVGEVVPENQLSEPTGTAGASGSIGTAGSSGSIGTAGAAGVAGAPTTPPGTGGSVTPPSNCPDPKSPSVHYVSHDPKTCAAADFICGDEQQQFDNECGCGCIDIISGCVAENEAQCIADPACQPGYKGKCDCTCPGPKGLEGKNCEMCSPDCFDFAACVPVTPGCPDPDSAAVHYISQNPEQCALIDFGCKSNQQGFSDQCGCGCVDAPSKCGVESEVQCKADPACQAGYASICDCSCPGGPKGYEPGGCSGCPASCFNFAACVPVPEGCPDPEAWYVHYLSQDAAKCAAIDFACSAGQQQFADGCGCGCIDMMD